MALKRTSEPALNPVSLGNAKDHLIVTHNQDDSLIRELVESATRLVEAHTARQFWRAEWTLFADGFRPVMELRVCPAVEIVEVAYTDTAGVDQVMNSADYELDAASEPARLVPAYGTDWPSTRDKVNAVRVKFLAGYDAEGYEIPSHAQRAILLLAGHWYENREAVGQVGSEIALAYESCVSALRWSVV